MTGSEVNYKLGFFHKQRSEGYMTGTEFYNEALSKLSSTQCESSTDEELANVHGLRNDNNQWPHVDGETDIGTEGGFCSMPTVRSANH